MTGRVFWILLVLSPSVSAAQRSAVAAPLGDIVGTWQSDTTGGSSARSMCEWSPMEGGVICEQTITALNGHVTHALNVFLPDPADQAFAYYGIPLPGEDAPATLLQISQHIWIYGGRRKAQDGLYHRTVNDFSARDGTYTWRQEFSADGSQWTVQRQGRAYRQRSLATGYRLVPLGHAQPDTTRWSTESWTGNDSAGPWGLQVMVATGHGHTTTDSVRFDPGTLELQWERSSAPSAVRRSGSQLTGSVDSGPARKAVAISVSGPVYSSTMDNLVIERLSLADGYGTVLTFWDGDHLERDTVRVRGREANDWVVDLGEPDAVETLWIDVTSREVTRHLYTWRRDRTQSEVMPDP